ncbi:hypothetical protein IMCC12053_211 [Celeribacter marinus]|uniref:Uncharacterized protein n=1 Tax=Celeribacter marinus TaxID=1397108 RepID=A0A0N9ZF14_9RHOB|nr:hypothetical protein IMCC12053_211 [Celeribacter marinus]
MRHGQPVGRTFLSTAQRPSHKKHQGHNCTDYEAQQTNVSVFMVTQVMRANKVDGTGSTLIQVAI